MFHLGGYKAAWSLCKSGKVSQTGLTYLSKLPSAEPRSRGECSVLPLSGMEKKIDESIHLVKGIPAWKITAQGNVQNFPTVSPLLLSSSSMDHSPNCMIPFVLIWFIAAPPCAPCCAAAWHPDARRLKAAPGHQNPILVIKGALLYHCLWGKKFKLIVYHLVTPSGIAGLLIDCYLQI